MVPVSGSIHSLFSTSILLHFPAPSTPYRMNLHPLQHVASIDDLIHPTFPFPSFCGSEREDGPGLEEPMLPPVAYFRSFVEREGYYRGGFKPIFFVAMRQGNKR
ncbi:hypothetical protein BT69DRAFT_813040 [Atractiella rhizophila]|nr:hypothetical protein BT69DRAFT_813040 [Atractiella rhizophila]